VRGREGNLATFRAHSFPADKVLIAGVVDGRNVWRTDLDAARALVQELAQVVAPERLQLSASCSLLHLRPAGWPDYLRWAVRAFRLATAGISPHIQIHTHTCYSEFGDIIEAIAALDADVISIADARSDGALLRRLRDFRYPQQIGPGVYDMHSSNVPTVDFIVGKLWATLAILPAEQVWVNPDCGLKTRG
jgi:methionine synthase II (cobalamin-independent)